MAIGSALSVGLIGLKAFIIQIQAFISPGLPYFFHHRTTRHLTFRGEGTGQVSMSGQRLQMARNPCHGKSLPRLHAKKRILA